MFKIENNKITMTRGDTLAAVLTITVKEDDETEYDYIPQEGDSIRFAVKHPQLNSNKTDYAEKNPVIIKSIPIDTMELILEPADTKPLGFGKYVYDIEITHADGVVDTFITTEDFKLTPEVY